MCILLGSGSPSDQIPTYRSHNDKGFAKISEVRPKDKELVSQRSGFRIPNISSLYDMLPKTSNMHYTLIFQIGTSYEALGSSHPLITSAGLK